MDDITEIFNSIIRQAGSVDIAESEFKRMMHADPELRAQYRDWCHIVGSTEKRGFLDYCEEYITNQNDIWDSLNDYDDV